MATPTRRASSPRPVPKTQPRHDPTAYARLRRLRRDRKAAGWRVYELWLTPEDDARLVALKQPRETLTALVSRALRALQAQGPPELPYEARKAALLARLWAMSAEEQLSAQEIANRLNEAHEPTLSRRGSWQAGAIRNLLRAHPRRP